MLRFTLNRDPPDLIFDDDDVALSSSSISTSPSPPVKPVVHDLTKQDWKQTTSTSFPVTSGYFVKYSRFDKEKKRTVSSAICQICQTRINSDSKDTWVRHLQSQHNKDDTDAYARYITATHSNVPPPHTTQQSTPISMSSSPPTTPTLHSSQRSIFDDSAEHIHQADHRL